MNLTACVAASALACTSLLAYEVANPHEIQQYGVCCGQGRAVRAALEVVRDQYFVWYHVWDVQGCVACADTRR